LELKGDPILMRTISSWLRPGTFAHVRPQSGAIGIKQFGERSRNPRESRRPVFKKRRQNLRKGVIVREFLHEHG
jgi:hypothetical protein